MIVRAVELVILVKPTGITRVNEHLFWDKNSHIFKHLSASKGRKYGGPEGTSLLYKNLAISLKLCHPSLKIVVVFCVNVTVLYRNERLFLKKLRSFPRLSSASSIKTIT